MNHKKELQAKSVHRFTDNALMKFRPNFYQSEAQPSESQGSSVVRKVSEILGGLFGTNNKNKNHAFPSASKNKTFSKSSIAEPSDIKNKSFVQPRKSKPSKIVDPAEDCERQADIRTLSKMQTHDDWMMEGDSTLLYLQKITIDTFLIGNQNQLDLITISGIYDNSIDTDLNWSLNLHKKITKLAVDNRKCLLALQCDDQILIYRYDSKRLKIQPKFVSKVKLLGQPKFLLFLKDSQFGVFYKVSASIYQVEENNTIRLIFNKKYGVADNLTLFQIPKPIQTLLNIFFIEKSQNSKTYILWRLQLQFKAITINHSFKSIARIYNIPSGLVDKFKIDNFSKEVIILNFKFEILAAKDGFIIDTANTNIQEDGSCLVYQGQNLLHISENKLFIYSFKILTNAKPNKIELKSTDSIDIKKDSHYSFFDCLEMLNGNFVLFFQVKPEYNNKLKGQIDYVITVTQKLSIQEKLNEIFSFKNPQQLKNLTLNNFELIQQKCDMAFKIGLSRKQVYFELWNKSNKKQISDYKFLLDTMDYETIKYQIQKKLKKSSMPFNEVYKIEQACFEMLRSDLFSNSVCTEKCIKNYLISHFLLRKLIYFKNTNLNNPNNMKNVMIINEQGQQQNAKMFMIDIQQYVQSSKFQLKSHFLEYVTKICNDAKDMEIEKFRIFMREFRFPLRIMYTQLIEDLIIQAKKKLINFLKIIPEILPFQYPLDQSMADYSLYQGLWSKIQKDEWSKNLHIQEISTIYNRNNVEQITKAVWFKRNQNTLHDLVALSKQKIISIQEFNASDNIFYFFIEKIFQYLKDEYQLIQVVDFLQINYVNLPPHLKGKIFLYKKLFDYFVAEKYSNNNISSFNHFLKLKDHDLFKELFNYEKVKKVCLLEDAKNIYEAIPNGIQMYYQGLLNYFASDLSEISDLKYILNRLNNKKREFHIQNEGIYAVLVRAMQMKLKLGSQNDIPLDEVMIYVENIPLSKNNPVIEDLKTLERINQESQRFKKMKLNMSLLQIIENCQDVITALVNEQIRDKKIIQMSDENQLIQTSYNILAQVQTIKDKIYKGKYSDLPYFIYLSKLLQVQEMIKYVSLLLNDKYLLQYYCVDDRLIQNLVLYMYKWKFNQDPVFVNNQQYIQELLTLLHEESQCRRYIESQIQFAIMLTTTSFQIEYPLTESDTISVEEISNIIENHSSEDIKRLDLHRLYEVIKQIQQLCVQMQLTSVQQLYEICIKRLINLNNIREAIPMIRQLIKLYGEQEHYSIVFCFMILGTILIQMPQVHRKGMIKIVFYTYDHPLQLLEIIEKRLNSKLSNDEQQSFLTNQLEKVRQYKCFNKDNLLLDEQVLSKISQNEQKYYYKLEDLIFQTWNHLNNNRQDFQRNYEYSFYYIMLLHNPYAIAKFISVNYKNINIRIFRSYMSYVFREDIFNGLNVLHFGKRIFLIVLESATSLLSVQVIASQYRGNDFSQDQLPLQIEEVDPTDTFLTKIHKSIKTFKFKIMSLKNSGKNEQINRKKKRIDALMSSQASIHDNEVSQYPFNDSDDNYEQLQDEKNGQELLLKPKKRGERHFDPNKERKMIMGRQGKNLALYLSSTGDNQLKRTSPKALKASKTFQNAYFSVNFSKGGGVKARKSSDSIKKGQLDMIQRSDSIGIKDEEMMVRDDELVLSHNQDDFFATAHPILIRPLSMEDNFMVKTYSPQKRMEESLGSSNQDSPYRSPSHLLSKQSVIHVEGLEEEEHQYQFGFRVNIKQIDDESFSPVEVVRKQLLQDVNSDTDYTFDLSPLAKEQQKQTGDFVDYLKSLIECIYEERGVSLSVLLQLIKLLKNSYPELKISSEFLDYYIALQNYNLKYRSDFLIREMFPISGIFLDSKDPIVLFQYVKNCILDIASYDRIVVIAQLLTTVLRKHDIKDDLYLSFLAREIELYGNDVSSSALELKMQKERIEGMLPQITTSTLFLERVQAILRPIASRDRREEAAQMIKEALRKKKKDILIRQFEKKIACLNI